MIILSTTTHQSTEACLGIYRQLQRLPTSLSSTSSTFILHRISDGTANIVDVLGGDVDRQSVR